MRFGSVIVPRPAMKVAITTSSNELRNANSKATTMPARMIGKVTDPFSGVAPRLSAYRKVGNQEYDWARRPSCCSLNSNSEVVTKVSLPTAIFSTISHHSLPSHAQRARN